jgi:hypothetical protein
LCLLGAGLVVASSQQPRTETQLEGSRPVGVEHPGLGFFRGGETTVTVSVPCRNDVTAMGFREPETNAQGLGMFRMSPI